MDELISIVILNWNGLVDLRDCLLSLEKQTYQPVEVLLVDNGSTDGSAEYVAERHPKVKLIRNWTNLGYCVAANQGLRAASANYVWLLNNDTVIADGALMEIMRSWQSAGDSVIGLFPKVMYHDRPQVFNAFGARWDKWGFVQPEARGQVDRMQFDRPRRVFGDIFVAPCFRRRPLLAIGGFDESFWTWSEDFDVSYRANCLGYEFLTCPGAVVYHKMSMSMRRNRYPVSAAQQQGIRNYLITFVKNYESRNLLLFFPWALVRIWIYHGIVRAVAQGRPIPEVLLSSVTSARNFVRMLPSALHERRTVQSVRKVTDAEIWSIGGQQVSQ